MSFLQSLKQFFTLKTSQELKAEEMLAKSKEVVYKNDYDLDFICAGHIAGLETKISDLNKCVQLAKRLLGPDLECLLNAPVLQHATLTVENNGIAMMWQSGNNADEMTILSVLSEKEKYKIICATKCIGSNTNNVAELVSGYLTFEEQTLPMWLVESLNLIKLANPNITDTPDPALDLNNVIKPAIKLHTESIQHVKNCQEIISYVLHDEFQDVAYFPKISLLQMITRKEHKLLKLKWHRYAKDTFLEMVLTYNLDDTVFFSFSLIGPTHVKAESSVMSIDHAKCFKVPSWVENEFNRILTSN